MHARNVFTTHAHMKTLRDGFECDSVDGLQSGMG